MIGLKGSDSAIYRLTEHEIDSDEFIFNPGWFESEKKSLFNFHETSQPLFLREEPKQTTAIIEIDPSLYVHYRSIYNLLDFLGDVGGLREAFKSIGFAILYLFGSQGLRNFLIKELFWIKSDSEETQTKGRATKSSLNA